MQKKHSILLVEDEENLQDALRLNFEMEGYDVTSAYDGAEALKAIHSEYFDLIVLDVMLPEIDGITVCENIRLFNSEIPILILSAKNSSTDRVMGLQKGADDYVTKPFDLTELLLRVKKLINKSKLISSKAPITEVFHFGKNNINFKALECKTKAGETVALTKKEAMLLKLLIENKNEVVTARKNFTGSMGLQCLSNNKNG